MIGKIHVYNNKTLKIVKTISEEELLHNEDLKRNLKEKYLNKDCLELVCGCNKDIKLNIDSAYRIYHKKKSDIHKHNRNCFKSPKYEELSSIKGWKENDKYIHVTLDKEHINLHDFIKLLNLYSWNTYIHKNLSLPSNKFEFLNRIYGISNKVKLLNHSNKTLNELYFALSDYKMLKKEDTRFVYMYLKEFKIDKENNIVHVTGEYSDNKTCSFVVDRKVFTSKYLNIKNEGINGSLVFSGFVKKVSSNLKLVAFELIRVNNLGVYCENIYEVKLFNSLYKNSLLFTKPYKPIPIYDGDTPNAILISNNAKSIYIEVFDDNSEKGLKLREYKVNKIKTILKSSHKLVVWDVHEHTDLPSINYMKKLIADTKKEKH